MALDEDLSKMKDEILTILPDVDCDVTKDRLNFFVWELNFLDSFLCLRSFAFAGECGMLHVIQKIQEIWKRLHAIIDGPDPEAYTKEFLTTSRKDEFIDSNTDPFTFHVPTEVWKIKLEFRAKYSFPKISSISLPANKDDDIPTPKFVMEFIDDVLKILGDLVKIDNPCSLLYVGRLKEQIEDVFKELKLLRLFICFVSNKCIEPQSQHSFFTHALIEAVHTAMVAWLNLPIHGNETQDLSPSEVNVLFSDLLKMKIKPIQPGIHKIYIDVLLALKSTIQPAGLHPNIQNKLVADCGIVENPTHNLMEIVPEAKCI
uniref:Late blight resistance protein R1-A-like n=1 Tax=Nicotiana sylvestris TaxID=4096 RepID=A0A1U7XM56_NICSY|nr:PREDICTED: late blight resistance protein R1-A-like [Nicotiana sylvestris]